MADNSDDKKDEFQLLCTSEFTIKFPKYREKYIREVFPIIKDVFKQHRLEAELDCIEGNMKVSNTIQSFDPFIILKGRELVRLVARGVPIEHAQKVLEEDVESIVVPINNYVRNKETFLKRRQRLMGSAGVTLKALEILTGCNIFVQGNTVSIIGSIAGIKNANSVVVDTMENIHPFFTLKILAMKQKLMKDPNRKNEDWSKYFPTIPKTNSKRKKPHKIRKKGEYTQFPPEMPQRKVDKEIETGEYFIKNKDKKQFKLQQKSKKKEEAEVARQAKRKSMFVLPEEPKPKKAKKDNDIDIEKFKKKLKKKQNKE